jgi:HlyD family secretion protein
MRDNDVDIKVKDTPGTKTLAEIEQATARRRRQLRVAVVAMLLLVLAGGAYLLFRGKAPAYTYVTAPVTRGPLIVTVTATGQLAPVTQVDIGSEVSGTIESVEADYNTRVHAGQVLARINTDKLKAAADQARAARDSAEAKTRETAATVKEDELAVWRCSQLRAKNLCAQETLDQSQAALAIAQASQAGAAAAVKQTQAALTQAETDLSKAVIRSPINGIVLSRSAEPGQTVAAAFQSPVLFTLAQDLAHMELDVDVDEADIGSVREGQPATFAVDAYPNRSFPAKLTQVRYGPKTIQGVVTYQAVLMVDNRGLLLRPGMTATASITVQHLENVLLVPNTALRFQPPESADTEGGGIMSSLLPHAPRSIMEKTRAPAQGAERDVWILQAGRPESVRIRIGDTDGTLTQVVAGDLAAGALIITDATARKP